MPEPAEMRPVLLRTLMDMPTPVVRATGVTTGLLACCDRGCDRGRDRWGFVNRTAKTAREGRLAWRSAAVGPDGHGDLDESHDDRNDGHDGVDRNRSRPPSVTKTRLPPPCSKILLSHPAPPEGNREGVPMRGASRDAGQGAARLQPAVPPRAGSFRIAAPLRGSRVRPVVQGGADISIIRPAGTGVADTVRAASGERSWRLRDRSQRHARAGSRSGRGR